VIPDFAQKKKADEKIVIDTTELCKDVLGHHAATPVEITVVGRKIQSVVALPSDETPSFFEQAVKVLDAFNGMTVKEALQADVDAISGATMSSEALITNVKTGLKTLQK
ncbi:MAG: FMN-binding protein, partial [Bacteroidales bacterium]|nr:FMN-binding protein [Bacteroidales bacterium]